VLTLSPKEPTIVNYIMACVEVPNTFGHIKSIEPTGDRELRVTDGKGKSVKLVADWRFLHSRGV
jgi:hypothetical protein